VASFYPRRNEEFLETVYQDAQRTGAFRR